MGAQQPNVVAFFWDAVGWGELGCYGGGVLRGAATPRIDKLAAEGVRLLNFNVEARSIASRSALLTSRHAIRSGTQDAPVTDGPDGLTRWEVTTAPALSDAGYATGMWGAWHLGSDPENRSPVDFGFDEPVWCLRAADEVLWTMPSYFPAGPVTATPYAGETGIPLEPQPIFSRAKGSKPEVISTYDPEFRAGFDRQITGWAADFMRRSSQPRQAVLCVPALHPDGRPADPRPALRGHHQAWQSGRPAGADGRLHRPHPRRARHAQSGRRHDRGVDVRQRGRPRLPDAGRDPDPFGGQWTGCSGPWRGGRSARWRARAGPRASSAGRTRCPRAGSATSSSTRWTCSPPSYWPEAA